ncbi:hypothetical protein [Ralstonia sp.]|uniref:hypothetical protein n=1 Tax=Ralstonia sp. TaxID=54061 RepID=UPI0031D1243B
MANRRKVPGIRPYDGPAGGWGALRATAQAIHDQMDEFQAPITWADVGKGQRAHARAAGAGGGGPYQIECNDHH